MKPMANACCALFLVVSSLGAQTRAELALMVGQTKSGLVTSVTDGDSIRVRLDDGMNIPVRLDGVDAPETGEPFSTQARNATRALVFDQRVEIKFTDLDRYDRLVGRVTFARQDASVELLRAGLACHFLRYSSDAALAAIESDARADGRGFWAAGAQKPACVAENAKLVAGNRGRGAPAPAAATPATRQGTTAPQPLIGSSAGRSAAAGPAGPFHGNTRSRVYHDRACPNYSCANCTAIFATQADAQRAGYKPAGDCVGK
jgi:endonuclease YncB( thermonuclease family)